MDDLIQIELAGARLLWPAWPTDPIHAAAVLAEEAGELVQAANDFTYSNGSLEHMREEAVQVAAMAMRFLDGLDKYERRKGY